MSDENKIEEWIPNVEEYNPNISKEKWLQLIEDKSVFNENAIVTFACIKNANVATCCDMSEEFGREKNFYNNNVWQTGKKVHLKTNCQLSERDNEDDRYWPVCCLGRYLDNGRFEYIIRPELEKAFEENGILKKVNLYKEMVDKEKEFREWMSVQNYNDGKEYTYKTINSYCNALKNAPKSLNIEDGYRRSIFSYDDSLSYIDVMNKIKKASNFKEVNDRYASGAFNAALSLYEKFLKNDYKNQNIMNKENNDNKGNNNKIQKYIDIIITNKNLILTGAPGTGKTFLAKQIAKEMGCSENEIGFVQFHPSYDYTDFVEGLRPVEKDGNIGFERKDGVFKEFCKWAAVDEVSDNEENEADYDFISCYKSLVDDIKQGVVKTIESRRGTSDQLVVGTKNTIKWRESNNNTKISSNCVSLDRLTALYEEYDTIEKVESMTNIEKSIRDVIGGSNTTYYWAVLHEVLRRMESGQKTQKQRKDNKYIFIIDEINRGEISKIFGELFYCIDPGYRGKKGCISTQYQNLVPEGDVFENGFYVPENVYIIGTMNDIDRSVESMDFAFRRRFAFIEVKANENLEMLYEELDENLAEKSKNRLINLNKKISEMEDDGLSSAYHIGASYFLKIKDYNGDFEKLWNYHLNGLLREYLRGMSNIEAKIESLKVAYDNESASNN